MKNKVLDKLLTPVEKLVRAMSSNWGLKLKVSGKSCKTDGSTMVIPFGAADLKDPKALKILHGKIDHEWAHEAEATRHKEAGRKDPFELMNGLDKRKEKMFFNIFEDIRIEHRYSGELPGVAENLRAANLESSELFRKNGGPGGNFWHTLGCAVVDRALGLPGDWISAEHQSYLGLADEEICAAPHAAWASDALELARRFLAKVEAKAEENERPEPKPKPEEGDESSSGGDDGESEGEDLEGSGSDSDGDGEESESSDESSDESGDRVDDESGKEREGVSGSDGDVEEGDVEEGDSDSEGSEDDSEKCKVARRALSEDADCDDLLEPLDGEIEKACEDPDDGRYRSSEAAIKAARWEVARRAPSEYHEAHAIVAGQIRGLKGKLVSLLKTRAEATEHYDRIEGDLDPDMLYSVPLKNKRIFSQTAPGEAIDTAISILIDESGSMRWGKRFEGARRMAIALGETLSALAIPFEVIGFDTGSRSAGSRIRTNSMNYRIFKAFNESYRAIKERFGSINYSGGNIDGEAVLAVAKRLASQREARKILIVLSDGIPDCRGLSSLVLKNHLREVVERVTASGIEVLGIGIQTNCVKEFYGAAQGANYIVVDDVNKLAVEVYKAFRAMLQGQKKERRVA